MHPTPEEQLRAVERRLDEVAAEASLTPPARDALDDARRLVRRLERSLATRLPFLLADNELATRLLIELAPLLPDLSSEIDAEVEVDPAAAGSGAGHDHAPFDEPTIHERNKHLQAMLGRAVHLLPDGPEGDAGRARIADHLRSRLAANPALHRTPTERRPTQEPKA